MWTHLKASWVWAEMIRCYREGDIVAASAAADRYRALKPNHAVFRALDATIDILNHNLAEARVKFTDLSMYLSGIKSNGSEYIRLYSEYYLCMIDEGAACDEIRRRALATPTPKRFKRWLSLPIEPVDLQPDH